MERIALIYNGGILYWSSVIISMSVLAAILCYLSLYLNKSGNTEAAVVSVPTALFLSLLLSRLVHWYASPESYDSLWNALINPSSGSYVLLGAFMGCMMTAVLTKIVGLHNSTPEMLDCMCLAGGAGIAVGRLSSFYNVSARGQIISTSLSLPWISPMTNSVSGAVEYRLATFLLQAAITGIITIILLFNYRKRDQQYKDGDTALLFLLYYCAAQFVLDSTRYDSVYFRHNGFISIVQVSCAVTIIIIIALLSIRMVKKHGLIVWNLLMWPAMVLLLGIAGSMEYFVQRHGDQALIGYLVMLVSLTAVVALTIFIYRRSQQPQKTRSL